VALGVLDLAAVFSMACASVVVSKGSHEHQMWHFGFTLLACSSEESRARCLSFLFARVPMLYSAINAGQTNSSTLSSHQHPANIVQIRFR
jgi:hypothetical protein